MTTDYDWDDWTKDDVKVRALMGKMETTFPGYARMVIILACSRTIAAMFGPAKDSSRADYLRRFPDYVRSMWRMMDEAIPRPPGTEDIPEAARNGGQMTEQEVNDAAITFAKTILPDVMKLNHEVIEALIGRMMSAYLMAHTCRGDETAMRQLIFAGWCDKLFTVMNDAEQTDRWTADEDEEV